MVLAQQIAVLLSAFLLGLAQCIPHIDNSVSEEFKKAQEVILLVTFEAAKVDVAGDPKAFYSKMRRRKLVTSAMEWEEFQASRQYHDLRGFYVLEKVQRRHAATFKFLEKMLPSDSILDSVAISNMFLIRATPSVYETLKNRADVIEISTNQRFSVKSERSQSKRANIGKMARTGRSLLAAEMFKVTRDLEGEPDVQWAVKKIGAEAVWTSSQGGAAQGEGVIMAVADSGALLTHPAISENYRGLYADGQVDHNYSWWDGVRAKIPYTLPSVCPISSNAPCDDYGHGSHCLSTSVGSKGIGVAPGSKWIACRNMNQGFGSTMTYMSCLNFFLAPHDLNGKHPRPNLRPHVINNSYGCPEYEGCSKTAFSAAVRILRASGIYMVASSGNLGPTCGSTTSPPEIEPDVTSIGAVDYNDNLGSFSARGPATMMGQTIRKPDLVAPGVQILGAWLNGGYRRLTGTSMSAPLVSGSVALMMSNCPCLKRNLPRIQAILEGTAVKRFPSPNLMIRGVYCGGDTPTSYPNNYYGYGRVDVFKAVLACREHCAELETKYPRLRGLSGSPDRRSESVMAPESGIFESSYMNSVILDNEPVKNALLH